MDRDRRLPGQRERLVGDILRSQLRSELARVTDEQYACVDRHPPKLASKSHTHPLSAAYVSIP